MSFFPSLSRSSVWNRSETGFQAVERKQHAGGDAQDQIPFSLPQQAANPDIVYLQCIVPLCLPEEKQASLTLNISRNKLPSSSFSIWCLNVSDRSHVLPMSSQMMPDAHERGGQGDQRVCLTGFLVLNKMAIAWC